MSGKRMSGYFKDKNGFDLSDISFPGSVLSSGYWKKNVSGKKEPGLVRSENIIQEFNLDLGSYYLLRLMITALYGLNAFL